MASLWKLSLAPLLLVLSAAAEDALVRESAALSPEEEWAALAVPAGFEISLYAAEPDIAKPINLALDERGRLWVSSTVEYPYAAPRERWVDDQGSRVRDSRDAILILEDRDGDGRAEHVTRFVEGLNIPTGVLPWHRPEHADGCIAWSIPNLWYFADSDGDGKADHREVLFGPLGYEKDTHGMISSLRRGSDGWIYATHGFNNTSRFVDRSGREVEMHSGNVFRFLPDASRVELWSRGQVNPFGLAFDRRGNLYSADCHSWPITQVLKGAVYPSFGRPHDGLGFGPSMIDHSHGSTGIAGIVYVDRGIWGPEWEDHVLIGNPVTSRVNLDRIFFSGTTPRAEERPDFITSEDPWFRPVDLSLAPDGALYVADFYNRIIGHYEVPLDHPGRDRERGRIWKVVRKGAARTPAESVQDIPPPGEGVSGLQSDSPWTRRAVAQRLLDHPEVESIPLLRQALKEAEAADTPLPDTHLRHALRLALRACLALPGALQGVEASDSEMFDLVLAVPTAEASSWLMRVERGTDYPSASFLEARRQHVAVHGEVQTVAALLSQETMDDEAFLDLAEACEERWGAIAQPFLLDAALQRAGALLPLAGKEESAPWEPVEGDPQGWGLQTRETMEGRPIEVLSSLAMGRAGAEEHVGRLRSPPFALPERLAFRLCGHDGPPGRPAHHQNFVRLLDARDGTELARSAPPRNDRAVLVEWSLPESRGRQVRLEIVDGDAGSAYAWLGVGELEGAALSVTDYGLQQRREARLRRFARLLAGLAPAALRDRLSAYLPSPPPAPPLAQSAEEREALDRLVRSRVEAYDPQNAQAERGRDLFARHCAACHRVSGEGGMLGPQLDGIGSRGLSRLAEDVLDPHRNVDAHFRLTRLECHDGRVLGGYVVREDGEVLVLLDPAGQAHRLRRSEVRSREVSALSLMPANFGERLSPEEFQDLMAWLLTQRIAP